MEDKLANDYKNELGNKNLLWRYSKKVRIAIYAFFAIMFASTVSLIVFGIVNFPLRISSIQDGMNKMKSVEENSEDDSTYAIEIVRYDKEYYIPVLKKNYYDLTEGEDIDRNINECNDISSGEKTNTTSGDIQNHGAKSSSTGLKVWLISSIVVLVISAIVLMKLSGRESVSNCDDLKKQFETLENVLKKYYCEKEDLIDNNKTVKKDEKNEGENKKQHIDSIKIDKLIEIYETRVNELVDSDNKASKAIFTTFSISGLILSTALASMDKIGIDFGDWTVIAIIILFCAASISLPFFVSKEFNLIRDRAKSMLTILKHYKVYISSDK